MTIEAGIFAHLIGNAGVRALVATRIYPLLVPQDVELPAIAYQRISGPRDHAHDGPSGLALARVQLTFVATSYDGAKSLAEAARAAMDGFSGVMGEMTVGACLLSNEMDQWAVAHEAPVVRHDYLIWYQE